MLRPVYSVLNGDSKGTGTKATLYRKGFESQIETYSQLNDITLGRLPQHDEVFVRVESKYYKEFLPIPLCDLKDLILDNPYLSFHEIAFKEFTKMYFDIDSKIPINDTLLAQAMQQVLAKLLPTKINPKIHKCVAVPLKNGVIPSHVPMNAH